MPWIYVKKVLTRRQLKELIVGELQNAVDQITTQLDKAKQEILNKITDLETQIAAGETPDLTALVLCCLNN